MKTNLIGINGKIGSGKDTVGKIIQYLVANKNLPKNMQYASIEELDSSADSYSNFQIKKFAGKLKQIGSILSGVSVEMFEDQEFKQKYMSEEWNNPNPVIYENGNKAWMPMTYREFLQKLGTEAMRDGLHTNVWVNALFADYKDVYIGDWGQGNHMYEKPNWIITDMRFPNEMEAVKAKGGITIRVVRTTFRTIETEFGKLSTVVQPEVDKLLGIQEHSSETALDGAEFDYEIINNGTIEDLVEKVREILIKENIL